MAELSAAAARSHEPGLAMRVYGEGCLAVALAGTFDPASVDRVRQLTRELHRLAPVELDVHTDVAHAARRATPS